MICYYRTDVYVYRTPRELELRFQNEPWRYLEKSRLYGTFFCYPPEERMDFLKTIVDGKLKGLVAEFHETAIAT